MIKRYMPQIKDIIEKYNIDTILDYGCGKAQHHLPLHWNSYKYDKKTQFENGYAGRKFDLVICIDVLEHIPEADSTRIIKEIFDYSDKYVFERRQQVRQVKL